MPYEGGDIFAGYTIQRLLGSGGMGEVYLARHPRLPRLDALKILSLEATGDGDFPARFIREAELAATLWHPHIVGVHDRGEFDGHLWISMDYVEGTDAGQLLTERYPSGMPYDDVAEIVTAVADALDFAHERRLLHRDVKPGNILVANSSAGARRRILLTDFGIARGADDVDGLTDVNVAIGTVNYAAPEQLVSNDIDGRVDQYALAATAYHLLTGVPLFSHANRVVVVGNHLKTPPPKLSTRRPDLAWLDAVMDKALAKDPDNRYPTCSAFARAFAGEPDVADQPSDTLVHTAAFDVARDLGDDSPPHTRRLTRMSVYGAARDVHKKQAGTDDDQEVWSFVVEQYGATGQLDSTVPVELRGTSITGHLADGDVVEVHGMFDGDTLLGESVQNHSVRPPGRPKGRSMAVTPADAARGSTRRARLAAVVVAVVAVVVVALAAVLTDGFGLWSHRAGPGPIVTPVSATVFSPGGSPDHPAEAELAIDGDAGTAWRSDTYVDATPFPAFKQGVGLILQLPEPTEIGAVQVELASTGTDIQIRAADSSSPGSLSDTTELTPPMPVQPGENRIVVDDHTPTSYVLVWIPKLGTLDGQSRTEISEITIEAAA
ncbi:Serine/threonine-protein kinase PknF [Mycolicibacterium vanbaalenii]|uniref:non-specific serine/threonine protein kinase n=1 Tax=Mycolicibacterium vanbaalenii TaxID=110539 RepID=A0A5S9QND0_MYCVN|nr:serine/threonine-protein kinase [Mycolicibacterium vanbaalenii]CAA0119919.1 Serine/threonine-protein kinase PknF [Mycolicibacterium vanbaalenii]